jgi:hypothetical protein
MVISVYPEPLQITEDWLTEIVRGNIPGYSIVHKFGASSVNTTLSPVTETGTYSTPTTATALEFVSDDTNDTSAGTGAREVTVIGLDSNWEEVTQTVTTNGTSAVALGTNLTRLYRWYVSSSGTYATQSASSHQGTLTIQESGGGTVWSTIGISPFPEGQSEIGAYSIPSGKIGYVLSQTLIVAGNKVVDSYFFQRDNIDDVSAPYTGIMRLINKFIGAEQSVTLAPKSPVGPLVGPCDVGFMAKTTSGTAEISVDFELLLEDV